MAKDSETSDYPHYPLPPDYRAIIDGRESIHCAIMGKDPFPSNATGIPFCKPSWTEQFEEKCSGRYVLQTLGLGEKFCRRNFATPRRLFHDLAEEGIVFLNASYCLIGEIIRVNNREHRQCLKDSAQINDPICDKTKLTILCGEAYKYEWNDNTKGVLIAVVHPAFTNSNHKSDAVKHRWKEIWDTPPGESVLFTYLEPILSRFRTIVRAEKNIRPDP